MPGTRFTYNSCSISCGWASNVKTPSKRHNQKLIRRNSSRSFIKTRRSETNLPTPWPYSLIYPLSALPLYPEHKLHSHTKFTNACCCSCSCSKISWNKKYEKKNGMAKMCAAASTTTAAVKICAAVAHESPCICLHASVDSMAVPGNFFPS